jgi:cobalt-zinc-cadmium efflux system protein
MGSWRLLRGSIDLILDAVPEGIDADAVQKYLSGLPGVIGVHHLHIWPLSTTETALTAHLVVTGPGPGPDFLPHVAEGLRHDMQIAHSTIQVEVSGEGAPCVPCVEASA